MSSSLAAQEFSSVRLALGWHWPKKVTPGRGERRQRNFRLLKLQPSTRRREKPQDWKDESCATRGCGNAAPVNRGATSSLLLTRHFRQKTDIVFPYCSILDVAPALALGSELARSAASGAGSEGQRYVRVRVCPTALRARCSLLVTAFREQLPAVNGYDGREGCAVGQYG
jgi:hypothetical protein